MATLVEQIRQMIDALAVVDPQAAEEFRGSSPNRPILAVLSQEVDPNAGQVPALRKTAAKQSHGKIIGADAVPACKSETNPLCINPMTDNLVKGIIYSEILGKSVSRRPRRVRQ